MDETTAKLATSSLAITEKRPQRDRPGGCVGIFFQLFDWNRRFAKKKLFSKKMLPPVRAKQVQKKFGGDEKMPKAKLHLIADENRGGFPNMKKNGSRSIVDLEPKNDMRAPGLVARLMGLDSMPDVRTDKPKKPLFAGSCDVREDKSVNQHSGSSMEDLKDKGCRKIESRPQKIQKTEPFERRIVTRFGAEALQIKGVLSRSRRNYHNKFASPIKSPRVSNARNVSRTSRLIDAATKILEPGLQATNRAKSALTYSSSTLYTSTDEVLSEARMEVVSPESSKQSTYDASICKSFMGQTSCRNCGNVLDVMDSGSNVEEQPFVYSTSASDFVSVSTLGVGNSEPRSPDKERDAAFRQQGQSVSLSALGKGSNETQLGSVPSPHRKPSLQEGQIQWKSTSQGCKPQIEEPYSFTSKERTRTQNQMSECRNRMPPRAKLTNLPDRNVSCSANTVSGAKDFVALNRNLSGRTRPRVPSRVDNASFDAERKSCNQRDGSLLQLRSPVRKRSVNGPVENTGFINSTLGRQRNLRGCMVTGQAKGLNSCSVNRTSIKSKAACERGSMRANGNKESGVISFTFNSPLRNKTENATHMKEKIKDQNDPTSKGACYRRKVMDENDGSLFLKTQFPLTGDALGALLEEKLKELTSQEDDELVTAGTTPKRSTAAILQELISALTAEQPISPDGHLLTADLPFQTKAKKKVTSVGSTHDGENLSPGSVLEASFSNDSCVSSSIDDSSGRRLQLDSMDYPQDQSQPAATDTDLLDSATSLSKGNAGNQMVIDLINQISRLLLSIEYVDLVLTGSKLSHAKDVILNAELLFGNTSLHKSGGMTDFLVAPFLLDELEVLASAMQPKFNCLLGFEATKEDNQLRGFLFDCWIECFDAKYGRYSNSGFKAWTRLPLRMKAEMLIQEVGEEIIRWMHLAGMTPDEIIECEMSHSLGKWTDFDIEAFETGAQIGGDIIQILVEEIVKDIWECRPVSS